MILNSIWKGIVGVAIAISLFLSTTTLPVMAQETTPPPNILYFQVDNLGFGEIGTYGGGILRGTATPRIDQFATEGFKLLNFAPESQCTPSRSAIMTGRYSIRSGTHTVALPGLPNGIVAWEKTMGDVLSAAGYNNYIVGKWHIGDTPGRFPTDHGFLHWYGIPRSYDESLYFEDPFYDPERDPGSHVVESVQGGELTEHALLTVDVKRNLDLEYMTHAKKWMQESKDAGKPFFMYFNHSLMHMPIVPRDEFKGATGYGDNADSLMELDSDFGEMLDYLEQLGVADNTIVVFAGENGPEEAIEWRGNPGFFEGSYFAGSEGNLRTPCIIRYPGKVPSNRESDEIVHITDMFTTLIRWAGAEIPDDRIIDGQDQRDFFEDKTEESAREGFPYWNGPDLYGIKWHHYKAKFVDQKYMFDPALKLPIPNLINLKEDPKERIPNNPRYYWASYHVFSILGDFQESVEKEPLIPAGAPLDATPDDYLPESSPQLSQINFPPS
ncbi:MAG: sulfatase-like hydrolase/transferase [Trichodesmium sp. MO_231.B1]|nr:sulfatase-like hydrolase/transferase [Trichodesmium sp. MO_231.B1]